MLAQAGVQVLVLEGEQQVGGGLRTQELTLPGFRHDVCSAIHPLGVASPFLKTLPLERLGVEWIHPDAPLAHPFDDGGAAVLERSLDATAAGLGEDGARYRKLMEPLCRHAPELMQEILSPLHAPRHPLLLARFGARGIQPAARLARSTFAGERARGLFAGMAAHSMLPLTRALTSAVGLTLGVLGHVAGWPLARGGSQAIADAMVAHLRELGGEVETGRRVTSLAELGDARAILLDVTPRQFLVDRRRPAAGHLPPPPRGLPLRAGRLQARLGARRPDPVALGGVLARRDRAPRRDARRDRGLRAGDLACRHLRAAVRPRRPADAVRSEPRARGQAHRVGVLPRPERLDRST